MHTILTHKIVFEIHNGDIHMGCFWQIYDKFKVTVFYTVPTAIRAPAVLRADRSKYGNNEGGKLRIHKSWPDMMRTIWGDHDCFIDTYFTMYNDIYSTDDGDYW